MDGFADAAYIVLSNANGPQAFRTLVYESLRRPEAISPQTMFDVLREVQRTYLNLTGASTHLSCPFPW
jgi:hypothetical protein